MSIVQKNLYTPGQNLNNQAENIDLNRVGDDKTFIDVNFGTSPATITIKTGSRIEANGNLYSVESNDAIFQMASTSHNYITFNGTSFSSAASMGTFDAAKGGYYTGTTRTLRWYIDQTNSMYSIDLTIVNTTDKVQSINAREGVKTDNVYIAIKKVAIGTWDMDTNATVSITHGLSDYTKIISVEGRIISDTNIIDTFDCTSTSGDNQVGVQSTGIGSTTFTLVRKSAPSRFDAGDYSGSANRGYVFITYEV